VCFIDRVHRDAAPAQPPHDHLPDDAREQRFADDQRRNLGAAVSRGDEEPNAFDCVLTGLLSMLAGTQRPHELEDIGAQPTSRRMWARMSP
jgi:hypothetical protein